MTLGDLRPFIALKPGLKNAGYEVLLISKNKKQMNSTDCFY
jgi:hypothetical protein